MYYGINRKYIALNSKTHHLLNIYRYRDNHKSLKTLAVTAVLQQGVHHCSLIVYKLT